MNRLLGFLGTTLGGWPGRAVGAPVSLMPALALSMEGTGAGFFAGRRSARELF